MFKRNDMEAIFEIEELKKDVAHFKGYHAGFYRVVGIVFNCALLTGMGAHLHHIS